MSAQRIDIELSTRPARSALALALRALVLLFTVIFGLIPFVLGIITQGVLRKRIPAYIVVPLGVAVFFVFWRLTGSLQWRIGNDDPVWLTLVFNLFIFVAFFSSGAVFIREWLPRRFSPASAPPAPQ
jgi:hypothetical protein